MAHDVLGIALC